MSKARISIPSVSQINAALKYLEKLTLSTTGGGGGGAVTSVNGEVGVVVLDMDDIGDGTTNKGVTAAEKTSYAAKQAALVSGTNIRTVNSASLLGSGNVTVGDVFLGGTNTFTGTNTFNNPSVFGGVIVSRSAIQNDSNATLTINGGTSGTTTFTGLVIAADVTANDSANAIALSANQLSGAHIALYGDTVGGVPGNAYIDFGSFTSAIPATSSFNVRGLNNGTAPIFLKVDKDGVTTLSNLAGTGSRLLLASSAGVLSAPATVSQSLITGLTQEADYIIETISGTVYARPRNNSGLTAYSGSDAYTVIQAAITALTPSGAVGTGGGTIHINTGSYTLTNELIINGWEAVGGPFSKLIIKGDGLSTRIYQTTTSKNAFVVKNNASFTLKDMYIECSTTGSLSALLLADNGTSNLSCQRSFINDVYFVSASSTQPACYFKNFFDLTVDNVTASNSNNTGMILENTATDNSCGNSLFGLIRCIGNTSSPFAGLSIKSTGANHTLDLITFNHIQCIQGYYGIYSSGGNNMNFLTVDIENVTKGIFLTGTSGFQTRYCTFYGGYVVVNTGGTAITSVTNFGYGNAFTNLLLDLDTTAVPILDQQSGGPANSYDLVFGFNTNAANISITAPTLTRLNYRKDDGSVVNRLPTGTIGTTQAAADNTTALATTAHVFAERTNTAALTNKTLTSGTNTFPTFNQSTTGSAATLTTPRSIYGNNFDGSAALAQIIASTFGGTGNGFTKFSGPTTSEKTFTLPDATSTILTSNAAVTVSQGGTGRATGTTAYALVAVGTTATGAQQSLAAGATTEILVGGGASALPVWTTASGSGAPVRATSPSLVTPVLGTPSSGTLTSCTGLPVSTGISGLGAGVATFLATPSSANLATAVTGETGTGALVFGTSPDFTTALTLGGVAIPTISSTSTLTNKRVTQRVSTTASSATPTPNADTDDVYTVTALAANATFGVPTGAPTDGQLLTIRIKDNATSRTLAWNSIYRQGTDFVLPTSTTISKTLYVQFIYNFADTKWDALGYTDGF